MSRHLLDQMLSEQSLSRIGSRTDMGQSRREDRKLSEVKGVLHRLQGLPVERQSAGSRPAELGFRRGYLAGFATTTTVMVTAAVVLVFGYALSGLRPQASSTPNGGPNRLPVFSKGPDAAGVFTGAVVSHEERTRTPTTVGPVVSPEERPGGWATVGPAVEAAQALMNSGSVQAARQQLLALASDGSADVAWALARSYDPNHLKGIQGADTAPDVAEATRWYRTWYAAAVKQGMITDSVSLEKIIGSMQP